MKYSMKKFLQENPFLPSFLVRGITRLAFLGGKGLFFGRVICQASLELLPAPTAGRKEGEERRGELPGHPTPTAEYPRLLC